MAAASNTLDASSGNSERAGSELPSGREHCDVLPRVLGRYVLLRLLVRGGMGEVFLATPSLHGGIEGAERPCIIKKIRHDYQKDPSFHARFLDEARVQAQLDDPGVARILEAAVDEHGDPFVAIEYVEGRSLADVRSRAAKVGKPLPWADAVAVALEIASALAHVHERTGPGGAPLGIVHRDLSPQNVMVGFGGDVKLIDFGTARGDNRRCQTVSGTVLAKPGYVAPEVARGEQATARADLYALGVMLWEMVAGRRYLEGDPNAHAAAVAAGALRPISLASDNSLAQLGDGPVPDALDRVIASLTEPLPSARCGRAREAAKALVDVLSSAPRRPVEERGVRARVKSMLARLYPSEPGTSRVEFSRMVSRARMVLASELASTPSIKSKTSEPTPSPRLTRIPDALPGTRYRVLRRLGEGAAGEVFEAEHVDLGRRVAVKLLQARHSGNAEYVARFRREARAIAGLDHPNLVRVHDFGETSVVPESDPAYELGGRLFFVMERLEGETLESYVEREKGMDFRDACEIGIQVCRALEAAHGAGLVHRDLKPANLFLAKNHGSQALKLLDFGVAKGASDPGMAGRAWWNDGAAEARADDPNLSRAGALFGTPETMSPEQIAGRPVDARADLYALGCVLYQLLTGTPAFDAPSSILLMSAHIQQAPKPLREVAPERGIPEALERVVMRALEKDADDRFPSATAMREALEEACFGGFFEAVDIAVPAPIDTSSGPSSLDREPWFSATADDSGETSFEVVSDLDEDEHALGHLEGMKAFDDDGERPTAPPSTNRPRRARTLAAFAATLAIVAAAGAAWKTRVPVATTAHAPELARVAAVAPAHAIAPSTDGVRESSAAVALPSSHAAAPANAAPVAAAAPRAKVSSAPVAISTPPSTPIVTSSPSTPTATTSPAATVLPTLAEIEDHMGRGDVEGALTLARLAKVAGNIDTLRAWARAAYSSARYAEAHDASVAWIAKAAGDDALQARLFDARSLHAAGRDDEARSRLEETVAKFPRSHEARALLKDLDQLRPAERLGRRSHPKSAKGLLGYH